MLPLQASLCELSSCLPHEPWHPDKRDLSLQDVAALSHLLVPYHAKQLSLSAQALKRQLDASKQAALPKKKFAFSKKAQHLGPEVTADAQSARSVPSDDVAAEAKQSLGAADKIAQNAHYIAPERSDVVAFSKYSSEFIIRLTTHLSDVCQAAEWAVILQPVRLT